MRAMSPFVEQQYRQLCEPENQRCRKLRRKKDLHPLSIRGRVMGRYDLPAERHASDEQRLGYRLL